MNVGKVGLYGLELEGGFQATEELNFQGSFAWNYTEYKEGLCKACVVNGSQAGPEDHLGNRFPFVPEYTASAVATYERPVFGGDVNGFARAEWLYEGTKFATESNKYETGDRQLVNLRLGFEQEVYRIEFYVKNLFENETYYNVSRQADLDDFSNAFVGALPERRTIGIRASLNY